MQDTRHKTQDTKNVLYSIFKWTIIIVSFIFLYREFNKYENYAELNAIFSDFSFSRFKWLFLVFLLLPINWLLEFYKWTYLCAPFEKISLLTSTKSVLSGLVAGFLSPNRIGELVGRPVFLKPENRVSAALMTFLNGFSQTIIIVACGIPSAVFFFFYFLRENSGEFQLYTWLCVIFLVVFLLIYLLLPKISRWLLKPLNPLKGTWRRYFRKSPLQGVGGKKALQTISEISVSRLLILLLFSFVRYVVFCLQFYFMLFFCGVEISLFEATITTTLYYLFITITPSFSVSEAVVRVSFAVFLIGFFSDNLIGIASAGLLLWVINFALPMLVGTVFFAKSKI